MSSYISLKAELEDWFEKSYDELPEDLRKRVDRGFRPLRPKSQDDQTSEEQRKKAWDDQTPDDRRRRACLLDDWENPAFEKEQRRLWDLAGIEYIAKIKEQIEIWEAADDEKARDLEVKQKKLRKLNKKLRKAQEQCARVLTPKTNRDKKLQVEANNPAKTLPKMGGDARGAQYARLKQQAIKLYMEGQFKSKKRASEDLYQSIKTHVYNEKFNIPAPKSSTIYRWLLEASSTSDT